MKKNKNIKKIILGSVLGLVGIGIISLILVFNFIRHTAADAATNVVKAKQEWTESGISPLDSVKNETIDLVKDELSSNPE